jgi:hypothetical protein
MMWYRINEIDPPVVKVQTDGATNPSVNYSYYYGRAKKDGIPDMRCSENKNRY